MPDPISNSEYIFFDKYEVDVPAGHLFKKGTRVKLRDQAFAVLAILLEKPGEVVTRDQLRQRLWTEDTFVDFDNSLNTAVSRLRIALGDSAEKPRFIETLPKRGYRFIGDLDQSAETAEAGSKLRIRIAVLPFVNLSGDPEKEYLAEGITEEFITELAMVNPEQLAVIARTTAMHYKGSQKGITQIGNELAARYVVEGSFRLEEEKIVVHIQLIQARDQTHLWARKYEADQRDIYKMLNSAAKGVSTKIGIRPMKRAYENGIEVPIKPTENVAAYNAYLQGRYNLNKRTPEGILAAKQCFEDAITRDPDFSLAHSSLAETYWNIGFLGFILPKDAFSMGVWSALRAIEIDDNLAEAHAVLGAFRKELDYNWTEVHREMKRALELNASSSFCRLFYGVSGLMPLGRVEAAVSELDYALDLDPLSSYLRCWLVLMLDLGRQYERGIDEATRVIENEPGYWLGHFMIGHLYRDMQSYDLALSSLKKSIKLSGESPFLLGWLGQSLANNGESTEARAIAERLQSIASQAYVPPTSFAWIYLGLGDVDQAFEWMDKAVDARDANIIPIKSYPFLDPLRDDPRFTELLRKMNLAP